MESRAHAAATGITWIVEPSHDKVRSGARPLKPSQDDFYTPPPGFENAKPGTVFRSREVELAFLGVIRQHATATQLLYRSTDLNNQSDVAVTTVILPKKVDLAGDTAPPTLPLVSYQCAIDAVTDRCFPSYALRRGARVFDSFTQFEFLLIAAALDRGWAVSVPDHEGVQGNWGAPNEPGYHTLDGLRAALTHEPLGLAPEAPIGLWGYSGGGLATAWAAEVSANYAPELNVVGAVLGSPVGDLGHTFRRLNGGFFAALPALVVAALVNVYPGLRQVVEDHITAEGKELLKRLETLPTLSAVARMAFTDMADLVDQPLEQILGTPEVQHVFESIKLGKTVPTPPILLIQAVHDEIISTSCIDELAEIYVGGGADVTYHRDPMNEHILLHVMSAPMAMDWLHAHLAGKKLPKNPKQISWPVALKFSTYWGLLKLGWITAKVLAGRAI